MTENHSNIYSDLNEFSTQLVSESPLWKHLSHLQTIQKLETGSQTIPDPFISSIHHAYLIDQSLPSSVLNQTLSELTNRVNPKSISASALYGLKPSSASLSDENSPLNLETLPSSDFLLSHILGEGGMGRVYSGIQTCLNREVALKVSKVDDQDARLVAQVFHEAQITANLDHPNILPVYLLAFDEEQRPIQVMKKIIGVTWAQLLAEPNHEMWSQLDYSADRLHFHLDILAQVCQAVSYAHDHKVIHRDLKPENVMIGRFGEVFVLDWGVSLYLPAIDSTLGDTDYHAQVSSGLDSALVGTPVYMPREMAQCDVNLLGAWTDVYLLGAILYEILCGVRIRPNTDLKQLFSNIMNGIIPNIPNEVSEEFKSLLLASLDPNIDNRIENGHSFRKLLKHAMRTDRAAQVQRKAQQLSLTLERSLLDENHNENDLSLLYDEARLAYRTSLEMWSESTRARSGLDQLHSLWADHLIDIEDLQGATRSISRLELPIPALSQRLEDAIRHRDQLHQEHIQLQEWHADEQISYSRPLRLLFASIGLVIFGFGSLTLDYLERTGRILIDAQQEFIAAVTFSVLVFAVFTIFAIKQRKVSIKTNAIFQRLVNYLIVIMITVSIQRFISWQLELSFQTLLHLEMTLIALGCFGLSAISGKKDFIWGAIAYGLASLFSLLYKDLSTTLYASAMIVLWSSVLLTWWLETDRQAIKGSKH